LTRRALVAMPAHALMLQARHRAQDRADAARMCVFARLRAVVNTRARLALLSGLAGGSTYNPYEKGTT